MSTWDDLYDKHARELSFVDDLGRLDWFQWGTYSQEIEYRFFKNDLFRLSRPFEIRDNYGLVIPTGFRLDTLGGPASQDQIRLYESYRRRHFSNRLSGVLRERYSVNIPDSVREKLGSND